MSKSRETELKSQLAQLKIELEQERAKLKQLQNEKVREVKSSKEKEQALVNEQKKLTRELFELNTNLKSAEDRIARLTAASKNKDDLLRQKDEEHRLEIEKMGRSGRKTSQQHTDELDVSNRRLQAKEKELSQLAEKLSRTMADKDKLEDEFKRLKQAESWIRRSSTPTSPTISPSTSVEQLAAVSKQVSKRERDMVIRNSELSFRVRTLEGELSDLKKENADVKTKLTESRSKLTPFKEQNNKLNIRINELNASLRSREKNVSSLSQENMDLKTSKQHLEEEYTHQRKSLQQQLTKGSSYRSELQKLTEKNKTVTDTNARLLMKVDRLETEKYELEDRLRNFTLTSPIPLSPPPFSPTPYQDDDDACSLSSSTGSVQLLEQISQMEFDKDENDVKLQELTKKYKEMKSEFLSLRGKYKILHSSYDESQLKLRELQTSYKQEESRSKQLEKESLQLEGEIDLLRRATNNTSLFDQDRQAVMMESLQRKVDEYVEEIDKLQVFITEQDAIWARQEEVWEDEKKVLVTKLEQLQQESLNDQREQDDNASSFVNGEDTESSENLSSVTGDSEVDILQQENAELAENLNTTESELALLQQRNDELSEVLTTTESQVVELQQRNTELSEVLTTTESQVVELQQRNTELSEVLTTTENQVVELQQRNTELDKSLTTSTQEVSSLQTANVRLTEELNVAADKVASLEERNAQLTQDVTKATGQVIDSVAADVQLTEEGDLLKKLLHDKEEECVNFSDRITQLEEQLTAANEEIISLTERENGGDTAIVYERAGEEHELAPPSTPPPSTPSHSSSSPSGRDSSHTDNEESGREESTDTSPNTVRQLSDLARQNKEQLEQKEDENIELHDSLSLAQANITMRSLLETQQTALRTQSQDHQILLTNKDDQISQLSDQLSQASSKLTRQRRAMPVGVNQQMAHELGHRVNTAMRKLSSVVQSSPGSNSQILSEIVSLQTVVNELLHTLFPGTFETSLTPVNSEPNLNSEPSVTSELSSNSDSDFLGKYTHDDLIDNSSRTSSPDTLPPHHSPHTPTPPHTSPPPPHTSVPTEEDVDYFQQVQAAPTFPLKSDVTLSKDALTPAWRESANDYTPTSRREQTSLTASVSATKSRTPRIEDQDSRVFVAVMDYEPQSLCVTGKPDDELNFTTGAVLAVQGSMDDDGYYVATFEGKTGRVPANFIQEVEVTDPLMKNRLFNQTLSRPLTPDSYTVPSRHTLMTTPTSSGLMQSFVRKTPKGAKDCPNPPTHFKVEKALGNSVLLVTWQPPAMDTADGSHSNGCLVTGYQLYVNGETKTLVSGAAQNKASLVGLNLSQPLTLGISTSGAEGKSSKVITIHQQARPISVTTVSSPSPEPEVYRVFIALYDYDPTKSSPCEHPEFELAFSEGDLIKIFGQEMDDGFMAGELNGQRGLVPASFVSQVTKPQIKGSGTGKHSNLRNSVTDSLPSTSVSPAPSQLPGTAKRMIASFDYNPEKDSPNPNPDLELSFKRGDEISVFGRMHGDGYYSGQLGDKFGLVPSNFLAKVNESPQESPIHKSHDQTAMPTKQQPVTSHAKISAKERVQRSNGLSKSEPKSFEHNGQKVKKKHGSDTRATSESPLEPGSHSKKKRHGFPWSKPSKTATVSQT